jgi:hypothetical protein
MFRDPERSGAVLVTLPEYMPASETIDLADALAGELGIPVLQLVINRVLPVLFAEKERPVLEALPSQIPEDHPIRGLAVAGRRRVLRETVQARAVRQVRTHIDAPCSELPIYENLGNDRNVMDALSKALLETW